MDAEQLKQWTKDIQAAFPGWQVVESGDIHDAIEGGRISIIDDRKHEIVVYETPKDDLCVDVYPYDEIARNTIIDGISWNLDETIWKELKRQERHTA